MGGGLVRWATVVASCHMRLARLVLRDILDLVHPQECAGCAACGHGLCPGCAARLAGPPFAHRPQPCPPGCPIVYAAAAYDGVVRQVMLAWKERGHRGVAHQLGAMLAAAVVAGARAQQVSGPLLVVAIPASRQALRNRGEDVLSRVAHAAVRELRVAGWDAAVHRVLELERAPRDQAGLDAAARLANLHGAMRATNAALPGTIVLVDDIVTTGVTLAEAARALAAAGRPPAFAATVAATPRRRPR